MASGVGGTVRFSGIVVGFAALGAILFNRVAATVAAGLPAGTSVDQAELIRTIAAGNLSAFGPGSALHALAIDSFGAGYQAVLFAAAAFAAVSGLLCWLLVRPADTAPLPRQSTTAQSLAVLAE
jgi:hypothetical protein